MQEMWHLGEQGGTQGELRKKREVEKKTGNSLSVRINVCDCWFSLSFLHETLSAADYLLFLHLVKYISKDLWTRENTGTPPPHGARLIHSHATDTKAGQGTELRA